MSTKMVRNTAKAFTSRWHVRGERKLFTCPLGRSWRKISNFDHMLYYWMHLVYVLVSAGLFKSKVDVDRTISHWRWVSPLDCEGFRFMSNTKYNFYMDFIRYELLFRSKLYSSTVKKGMSPSLGSLKLIYRKPLRIWNGFRLTLHLEGCDGRWAYHRHVFSRKGSVYAIGYTRVAFLKGGKPQDMHGILKDSEASDPGKSPPPAVLALFANDKRFIQEGEVHA